MVLLFVADFSGFRIKSLGYGSYLSSFILGSFYCEFIMVLQAGFKK